MIRRMSISDLNLDVIATNALLCLYDSALTGEAPTTEDSCIAIRKHLNTHVCLHL